MPELPEVEAVCRKLRRDARGATIVRARLPRKPDRRLQRGVRNRRIEQIERRGKNLLLRLEGGCSVRAHLRMTGNLYVLAGDAARPVAVRSWLELSDGRRLVFDDPRALGVLEFWRDAELAELLAGLGPEPLSSEFTVDSLVASARSSRRPAKLYLLDQSRIAGLGNIYAAESLHRARIHPANPMNRLSKRRLSRLHAAIVEVLADAVESACNAYAGPGRYNSEETFPVAVYGREALPCPVCSTPICRIPQGGRSTYYCPACQKR